MAPRPMTRFVQRSTVECRHDDRSLTTLLSVKASNIVNAELRETLTAEVPAQLQVGL